MEGDFIDSNRIKCSSPPANLTLSTDGENSVKFWVGLSLNNQNYYYNDTYFIYRSDENIYEIYPQVGPFSGLARIQIINYTYFDIDSPETKKCLFNGHYATDMEIIADQDEQSGFSLFCVSPSIDSLVLNQAGQYTVPISLQISSNEADFGQPINFTYYEDPVLT